MDVRKDFMNSMRSPEKHNFYENYFVARQPVFTASGKCWGYELLFRSPANTFRADFSCDSFASSQVIVDGLPMILSDISAGCKAMINMSTDMLRDRISLALPKERCVIEILENVEAVRIFCGNWPLSERAATFWLLMTMPGSRISDSFSIWWILSRWISGL